MRRRRISITRVGIANPNWHEDPLLGTAQRVTPSRIVEHNVCCWNPSLRKTSLVRLCGRTNFTLDSDGPMAYDVKAEVVFVVESGRQKVHGFGLN